MRQFLISAVVFSLTAGVAHAQSKPSYESLAKAKQGAWSEYSMTMPGAPQKMTVRYAIVTKNEREMTMETDSQTPMGPMHSSMTFVPSPPDAYKLVKARVQLGTQAPMDMPAAKLSEGAIKKGDSFGKLVGPEKVTVPAGTFETKHYKQDMPKEAGGMVLDVWMSDKAVPTGVVKLSGGGGIEMVLTSTGMGAKPKPESTATAPAPSGGEAKPAATKPADTTKK